ncbi:MAG: hypothetical protein ACR65O_10940 [Methylomicrobium sp.]
MGRLSEERIKKVLEQFKSLSEEDHAKIKALAAVVKPIRSVLHKTPNHYGMSGWRDNYFPSDEGASLEGGYLSIKSGERASRSPGEAIEVFLSHVGRIVISLGDH